MFRRAAVAILLIGAAAVAAACSMPSNDGPQPVSLGEESAELLEPAPTTASTTATTLPNTREVGRYFIEDDRLQRQSDQFESTQARSLTEVLRLLVDGTRQENHRSAIPAGVEVVETRIDEDSDVATIVLSDATLFSIESDERLRAIAQFVFTATDRNGATFGVDEIRFEIDGEIRTIPTGGGNDTSDPVDRCDYEDFAGSDDQIRGCPSATTTTTTTTTTRLPSGPVS